MKAGVSWLWTAVILMLAPIAARAQDGWTALVVPAANGTAGSASYLPVAVRVKSFDECPLAVAIDWTNADVVPAQDAWQARLWIKAGDMMLLPARAEKTVPVLLPGETRTTDNCFGLPVGVAGGRYELYLQLANARSGRAMALPLDHGDADNRYPLGQVAIP